MRKLILTMVLMFSTTAFGQGIFPDQPVEIKPGYGADGAGLHSGVPYGLPGNDCVINPVSLTHRLTTKTITTITAGTIITIPATVLFDFDGDIVRPEGEELLTAKVLTALIDAGVTSINIVGHTDARGTEEYNEGLGRRRAGAVASVLTFAGFGGNITVGTGGELSPIAPNANEDGSDNPEGRQLNRRVELIVTNVQDNAENTTQEVIAGRNPQIIHRLGSYGTVGCESTGFNNAYHYWFR